MIAGKKFELHALEPQHLKNANKWVNDADVQRFLSVHQPIPMHATQKFYESVSTDPNTHVFAVLTKTGVHIGTIGLHAIDWKNRHAELGIALGDKKHLDRGYGTDTIITLMNFAFGELNLHRISLKTWEYNKRAIRCYEKCGFKHEGVLRDHLFRDGEWHNAICMGILKEEFLALEKN